MFEVGASAHGRAPRKIRHDNNSGLRAVR
jgi:hypothetical protein